MKVVVFHAERFGVTEGPYQRVAVVNAPQTDVYEALEYAYRWTNNVMGSWSRDDIENNGDYNPNVERVCPLHEGGYGLRSTSMGDVMYCEGGKYEVASMGFDKVA